MSTPEFSEEELRRIEAEMERITVDDVLLQTVVTLLNLGARKAGPPPGAGGEEPKRDLDQLRQAIEAVRALLPLLEQRHGDKLGPVRDTLAQLQMIYAQSARGGEARRAGDEAKEPPAPGEPGPAQQSGRLWVPGQ